VVWWPQALAGNLLKDIEREKKQGVKRAPELVRLVTCLVGILEGVAGVVFSPVSTLHPQPSPYTLNPHSTPSTLTLHPQPSPYTLNPHPTPSTLNTQPSTLNPQPSILNPTPSRPNPKPSTLNPQP